MSPTAFGEDGLYGGGERYAEELARAMAEHAKVKLVVFGREAKRTALAPGCERVILRSWTSDAMTPFSPRLFRELAEADVVHCFQYYMLPTFLAALYSRLQRRKVFVTDLGGGGWTPGYQIDQSRWVTAHLPISRYAARELAGRNQRSTVIYGGVDLARYPMRDAPTHDGSVVFLGRLLPHKGIHFLIEGLPPEVPLHVVGAEGEPEYVARLEKLARGKTVTFYRDLGDDQVTGLLRRAMALVHPTPVDDSGSAGAHELLGLAPIEAMACGCPVVASGVASLPEVVADGETGLLVPANDPDAIRDALGRLKHDTGLWRRLSAGARERVARDFTWRRTAARCLTIYRSEPGDPA